MSHALILFKPLLNVHLLMKKMIPNHKYIQYLISIYVKNEILFVVQKVRRVESVQSIKSSTFCVHKNKIKIDFNGVETTNTESMTQNILYHGEKFRCKQTYVYILIFVQ